MSFIFTNIGKHPDMSTYRTKSLCIKSNGYFDPPSIIMYVNVDIEI